MRSSAVVACLAIMSPVAAHAQSVDCARAHTAIDRAICTQPSLGALDRALADAYQAASARPQADAAALRAAQLAWLRTRDQTCQVPAQALSACLTTQYNTRLAALAPARPAAAPGSPTGTPTGTLTAIPAAVAPQPAPAIPSAANPPPAAARLDRAAVPATARGEAILMVASPGRFSITAHSGAGAALQLVDQMAGPGEVAGAPGVQDGRIDALLDIGTYKLRVTPAEHATGDVELAVAPFRDAAPPAAAPAPGATLPGTLADRQQRAFWTVVGADGLVRIDAAGRALGDLRLWRDGTDLVDIAPAPRAVEAVRGHPMAGLRLLGKTEPGTYLVIVYGAAPLPWADGAPALPFYLRVGPATALTEGFAAGAIGPMGSEWFLAPPRAGLFRLDLPAAARAGLAVDNQSADIAANSREPSATVLTPPNRALVEVTGAAGQQYSLRAEEASTEQTITRPGRYWVSAVAAGAGGDEVPPTFMLLQREARRPLRILASTVPAVGANATWRAQFNVRGPTTLILQNTASGEVAVRNASQGLGAVQWRPSRADVPAGYLDYTLAPPDGKQGVADLLFGATAATAPPAALRWPADPVIPFGVQTVTATQSLALDANDAPRLVPGLLYRPAPVALNEGPLTLMQMPGVPLDIPVKLGAAGALVVSDPAAGPLAVPVRAASDGSSIVTLPAPDQPRTIVLALRSAPPPRAAIPAPGPRDAGAALGTGAPRFLDLARDGAATFDLVAAEGGLYRIETLGRLHTTVALGTAFAPTLDSQEANGIGENALLQRWLRAGRFRVTVNVSESAGHLGVRVSRAPIADAATLLPGGAVRARMPAGTGLGVPIEIAEAGRYRLDLAGLDRTFQARLDDADGWPLTAPGKMTTVEQDLAPGRYRLLVSPEPVDAQAVARLLRIVKPQEITGHGPHALAPETAVQATWREPAGRDDPRAPDVWAFDLAGPADATLRITAGMEARVLRDGEQVARVIGPAPYHGPLAPGRYQVQATSVGRNDRLDYRLTLSTAELQPGVTRSVAPDAKIPFTLAEPRVVSLTTYGPLALRAVLRTQAGEVLGRYGERGDDWNVAISRLLPAGTYRLDLSPATPPSSTDAPAAADPPNLPDPLTDRPPNQGTDADDAPALPPGEPDAQTKPSDRAASDAPADPDTPGAPPTPPKVELTLALPEARATQPAPAGVATLEGGGVQRLAPAQPAAGQLMLATAHASAAVVLTLERGQGDAWRTVALDTGTAPVVAAPTDGAADGWRMSVWPVDGGTLPITASVAAVDRTPVAAGNVSPRLLDDTATPVALARLRLDASGPVRLVGGDVLAGAAPGQALLPPDDGVAEPADGTLWLVARSGAAVQASVVQAAANAPTVVPVRAGASAHLTAPAPGRGVFRAWRADSGLGQPGLDAGQGMGVAPGSALAAGPGAVRVFDAAGSDVLRPRVTPLDLAVQPAQRIDGPLSVVLPPMSALPLTLPEGDRRTDLALAAGTAAVAGQGATATTVWTGDAGEARSLFGGWTDLVLLNTTNAPAPAAVSWVAASAPVLKPGVAMKTFFGASGSFDVPVEAPPGARLVLVGDATAAFVAADGRVQRGASIVPGGPGRLTISHAPGPIAVWLDAPGATPWPAVDPVAAMLPSTVTLEGPAMIAALSPGGPVLLHARTTAPVILTLGDAAPVLYPAGAVLSQYVAGNVALRVDSPHEGPLTGTLELTADPVTPVMDGLGAPVALAPGEAAVFAFSVPRAAEIGVGVRADPDRARVRLLAENGAVLGEGVALLRRLEAGRYLIEARLPPDAPASVVRPAVVGIAPRSSGPPPDVAHSYLELVGLAPKDGSP